MRGGVERVAGKEGDKRHTVDLTISASKRGKEKASDAEKRIWWGGGNKENQGRS